MAVPAVAVPRMAVVAVVSVCPPGMCCVGHAQLPGQARRPHACGDRGRHCTVHIQGRVSMGMPMPYRGCVEKRAAMQWHKQWHFTEVRPRSHRPPIKVGARSLDCRAT